MTGLRRYAATARNLWWLFAACVVVVTAISGALSLAKQTTYTSTVQVLIQSSTSSTAVADAQLVARSDGYFRQAAGALHVDETDLRSMLSVSNPAGTNAIQFSIKASGRATAISQANTVGKNFESYYGRFIASGGSVNGAPTAKEVSPALTAVASASSTGRALAIGVVGGLVVALLIVGVLEAADRTIRFPEEVRTLLGVPVTYLPTSATPARNAVAAKLAHQVSGWDDERGTQIVGLLAAGGSTRPATIVATLLADQLAVEDRKAEVVRLRQLRLGEARPVGTVFASTNGNEAMTSAAPDLPVRLWGVVVHLGQATRDDLDQIRLLFGRNALQEGGMLAIAIPSVDVRFERRRVKPSRPW